MRHCSLYIAVAVLAIEIAATLDECGENSHYEQCPHIDCPRGQACPAVCIPACVCNPGYTYNKDHICVKEQFLECGENSHYDKCPPIHCPPGKACVQVCRPACVCNPGYKFNNKNVCVKDQLHAQCGTNEHFESQSNRCQITCENMAMEPYMGACLPQDACFCNGNDVRNEDGICIDRRDCPEPKCPANETMSACANGCIFEQCPVADQGPPPVCSPPEKCFPGCTCARGYYRLDGKCVLKKDCNVYCGEHGYYSECTNPCPDGQLCAIQCLDGCLCEDGYSNVGRYGTCVEDSCK